MRTGSAATRAAWSLSAVLAAWAAVVVTHATLLRLPYYWDEAGYYVPAAYDFFRTGALIPHSTISNAHPPLPSILLAAAWKVFGFRPIVTRVAVAFVAAIALVAVYRIARSYVERAPAAVVTLLTATYPIWFAQSTLAHADVFAAAFTLWGLALFTRALKAGPGVVVCFCLAALAKETAVITPLALAGWSAVEAIRGRRSWLRGTLPWLIPTILLACWYLYHRARTGYMFGNPEFFRYNATGTWHMDRIAFALVQRAWHVTGHMYLFVAALLTLLLWLMPARGGPERAKANHDRTTALTVIFVANLLFFSVVGGALLTRYLLPLYPLVLLFHVAFWQRRTRWWLVPAGVTAIAFIAGWTVNPPYGFAAEDNLSYRDSVVLAQEAIAHLPPASPQLCVMTAWPLSNDLSEPFLGYVEQPYSVAALPDLALSTITSPQARSGCAYTILFSSNPYTGDHAWSLRGRAAAANREYFGAHENVPPAFAARLLGQPIQWQQETRGQWAAVLGQPAPVLDAQAASGPRFYNGR